MAEPTLRVTASSLSKGTAGRGDVSRYQAKLQALDKNGDGQLDLDEVCDAIDEIVRKEKTERTLKWLLAALALFSLLTIAATVGLTYAVVALSKDTQVDGSVLQSKDSGEALRTGSFLQSQNATALASSVAASADPAAALGRVASVKVPSFKEGEAYTVHKVDAITMLLNSSVLVRTATGLTVLMPAANLVAPTANADAPEAAPAPGRKLLQANTTAVGASAGMTSQGASAVAIGVQAGSNFQGISATAVGNQAVRTSQGANAVAVGNTAGSNTQGANSITVTVNQGPSTLGTAYRTYSLTGVNPSSTKVGTVKDLIAAKPLAPLAGAITLFFGATKLTDDDQKLSQISGFVASPVLTIATRQVDVWPRCATGDLDCFTVAAAKTVHPAVEDTVGGIKREIQAKGGALVDEQLIAPFATDETQELADDLLISAIGANCPSVTECSVDRFPKIMLLA